MPQLSLKQGVEAVEATMIHKKTLATVVTELNAALPAAAPPAAPPVPFTEDDVKTAVQDWKTGYDDDEERIAIALLLLQGPVTSWKLFRRNFNFRGEIKLSLGRLLGIIALTVLCCFLLFGVYSCTRSKPAQPTAPTGTEAKPTEKTEAPAGSTGPGVLPKDTTTGGAPKDNKLPGPGVPWPPPK